VNRDELATLERISRRVLWLAVRMVDYANHERAKPDGLKVGGHQASSASMVSMMTALWWGFLRRHDRVSVKPHASPVLHAVNYLLGNLDRRYLTELRAFGGLQSYPSRTKDPDPVDYSTGSVGLGAVAPIFGAVTARYLRNHFGNKEDGRFISLVGDAELDEGNIWEAISDPVVQGLTDVLWVVDLNRQSLDRIVPGMKVGRLEKLFEANDWQVVEAKYGRRLQELFGRPGGDALRRHIDDMSNEDYQGLFTIPAGQVRDRFLAGADPGVKRAIEDVPDADLRRTLADLGGHDIAELLRAFAAVAWDRPAVVFAYTIKGWGLPIAGDRLNHAALLTEAQIDELRESVGLDRSNEWDRFDPGSAAGRLCAEVHSRLARPVPRPKDLSTVVPVSSGARVGKVTSTQEAFGRTLGELARHREAAARIVTASPDVTISTNLGGWVNKVGVFAPDARPEPAGENQLLRWVEGPSGQHLELDLSEMNLFLLLGQLGLAGDTFGEPLAAVGTVYDPFVLRGLDAFIYSLYAGGRFVVVGTPAGIALGYEGGAHQSVITPSVGTELPGVCFYELAYATPVDWVFCHALANVLAPEGESAYLRLSTRPVEQMPFESLRQRVGDEQLRADVLAGGYRLIDGLELAPGGDVVQLVASGTVLPEVVEAAGRLAREGVAASVVDVTSVDRLFREWRASVVRAVDRAERPAAPSQIERLFPVDQRTAPIVTVHDGAPHTMSWLGAVRGVPVVPLGVDAFGQVGAIPDLYRSYRIDADSVVNAALLALDGGADARTEGTGG
jgi:pyruvate dehydrogenase E1 component